MTVKELLKREDVTIGEIAAHLEGLDFETRLSEVLALGKGPQRKLFALAADGGALSLNDFVPEEASPGIEVIHEGRNTLPFFRRFQKRMCRPQDGSARLFGYNEGFTRKFIGPGYFVLHTTEGHEAAWQERGPQVVNYFEVPDGPVVDGWPEVVPNEKGLQKFVYRGTRDFMRRVSSDVTIGEAFRGDKSLNSFFVLVRRPLS